MPAITDNDFAQVMSELIDEYRFAERRTVPKPGARAELRRLKPQTDPVHQKLTQMGVNMEELRRFL